MSYSSTILADAPVHYWRLNEPFGAHSVFDLGSSPTNLYIAGDGTASQFVPPTSGFGYTGPTSDGLAACFSQMSLVQRWQTPQGVLPGAVQLPVPGTIEAFFFVNGPQAGLQIGWSTPTLPLNERLWGLTIAESQGIAQAGTIFSQFPTNLNYAWHLISAVFTTSSVSLNIDGTQVSTAAVTLTASSNNQWFQLGLSPNVPVGAFGDCFLSEVAVYSVALSPGLSLAHFQAADHLAPPIFIGRIASVSPILPSGWIVGAVHTGLTGTGEITLASRDAVQMTVTITPPQLGQAVDTPPFIFDLGFMTPITAEGAAQSQRINRAQQVFYMPANTTAIAWNLLGGAVATLTELAFSFSSR